MAENPTLIDIPLDEFMKTPSTLGLEVYLRLTETQTSVTPYGRYVKLAHGAEDLDEDRVKELKSRGIDKLYLNLENLDRYIEYERRILRAAAQSQTIDTRKKLNLVRTTFNHILRRAFSADISKVPLALLQEAIYDTLEMLQALPKGKKLIECLDSLPDDIFNHASVSAILSLLLAKELKWASPIVLQKIVLVSLFHDIGMKAIPEAYRCTHPGFLDYQGRIIYNTHPEKSSAELSKIPGIGTDILLSVQQHHERLDGSGFPKGLTSGKIQPLAQLVAIADIFLEDYYLLEDRSSGRVETIIKNIAETKAKALPGDAILALSRVFQTTLDENTMNILVRGGLNIG